VNDTLSVPFFAKKNRRHIVYNCLESGHCGGWKNKTLVFLIYFDSNHLENTLGTLFNQSIAFKNLKIIQKPIINLKSKIFQSSGLFFIGVFKVRKHLIITLLIIWNKINIKINRFRAWNHRQERLYLFQLKSQDPLLSLPLKKTEKKRGKWSMVPKCNVKSYRDRLTK